MAKLRHVFQSVGIAVLITVFVILVILVLWLVEEQVVWLWNAKGVNGKDLFKAKNDALTTFAQILGGFAILIGVYFAWRNLTATTKNLELANKNFELATKDLELTKEGQVTERFTKAIEQLGATDDKGKPELELRLGGIYALERIARDSERDHWPIMEILTAYVREHAHHHHLPYRAIAADIQAILTVIGRRNMSHEKSGQTLDLHATELHAANLRDAHLEGADLEGADLTGAHEVAQEQVNSALGDATTKLPAGIVIPESWKKK